MKRAVLCVLDGFGAGAMDDVETERPQDKGSNTMRHVLEATGVHLPFLARLGLSQILCEPSLMPMTPALASYGRCNLQHTGADSYAGHNEIMGARPIPPKKQFIRDLAPEIEQRLHEHGYAVTRPIEGTGILLVDGEVVIADNMENDPGQIINITASLDVTPFDKVERIGKVVRAVAHTSRVIPLAGTGITVEDILQCVVIQRDRTGVDMGKLDIYNEHYHVRHLGYGIDPDKQIQSILMRHGLGTYLYGKMADVITGDVMDRNPMVDSQGVVDLICGRLENMDSGLIAATIQETDLAGHEQNAEKFAAVLSIADAGLHRIYGLLQEGELLIVTADHGNDPTHGTSQHTRETTPLLVCVKGAPARPLGLRATLADVGATVAAYFGVEAPEFGTSVL
ncbi:phosphopentomutase [Alicyclobacillus macrosporangiidus]|uniref:Phosphopentomutase n=1 Tax=Alicyclobacillus macrosporangiidus TaxID=392015 RepID=A0A1I7L9U7_9BACL|nr:phosphopentomutase [Alicyclobacillus macrosporangiidus]SFV06254.1 Phosphopentomutase [Alicyclobacillus macrosporangiidus]